MKDGWIRRRYGYGAAHVCLHVAAYRPERFETLPPATRIRRALRDGVAGAVIVALAVVALDLLLRAPPDDPALRIVPFETAALPEPPPKPEPTIAPAPPPPKQVERPKARPKPVEVAKLVPPPPPKKTTPPPKKPEAPQRPRPKVQIDRVSEPETPTPTLARSERVQRAAPKLPRFDVAPVAPVLPERTTTPRPERAPTRVARVAPARPKVAIEPVRGAGTPLPPVPAPAPAPPTRQPPRHAPSPKRTRRPAMHVPAAAGATPDEPTRAPRTTRLSAPPPKRSRTARPSVAPSVPSLRPRAAASPAPRPTRTERASTTATNGRTRSGDGIAGVPLGSLAACLTDQEEDALKQKVLAAVTTQEECVSDAGRYRFVETKNLNAFLMWIQRAPQRTEADRCVELRYALDCIVKQRSTR